MDRILERRLKVLGLAVLLLGIVELVAVSRTTQGGVHSVLSWVGIAAGIVLVGLGGGIFGAGRNIARHRKAALKGK